ncbi:tRNA (adenine(58)-N(1))-methyltransferase non-catalytic subunit trm6 [Coemansia sp. RSA 922]|nr:tRNA (adenine(58)-N(1))-methyltransferase non-catalytic subunit trm6 [Coemansia sp. S680]KAJ2066239.1 tRNA (adenine(58)-N(1))-methyltransferase non-catalytic subunit trm6 [Coemansia sp. S2]KAJ2109001.1 tRNA (adenine(58)-N(1))-methyltransferase non-catalytic subunit trm6 [Coemansia sp. RSA 922]KAJ2351508.1 tRNA (adenine(58)-N(1))-methyltransferase non-catalytic subunit trm6 [Coemansia sp. RSA 2673]
MIASQLDPMVIKSGDNVIIRMPSTNAKIVTLNPAKSVSLGKFGSFNASELIGKTFGHTYEIEKGGSIVPHTIAGFDSADITEANNKEIVDNPKSQKLTFQEIEQLKTMSLSGDVSAQEIIASLTENNESFDKKTEFSKSKYILRKQRKFMKSFVPLETSVYNLCNYFFEFNPGKIRGIRADTLSQVLSLANVYSNARILAVDDGQGIIIGALLSRMAAGGQVLGIHDGDVSNYDVIRYMNFTTDTRDRLQTLPWSKLYHNVEPFTEQLAEGASEDDRFGRERRLRGHSRLSDSLDNLRRGEFDALVISTNYNSKSVIERLVPYLGGSRMLVVYDQSKDALLETFAWLRQSPDFLNVQLTESWLREYQVLPSRTHPMMNTSGGGGFILSAIHLAPAEKPATDSSS